MRNGFVSIYYMRTRYGHFATSLKSMRLIRSCIKGLVIIDSGAHTFFNASGGGIGSAGGQKKKTGITETPHEYFANYVQWLKAFRGLYDYFVELDVGEIVGQETVEKWREVLRKEGLLDKCLPVFHPAVETIEDFIQRLDSWPSRYVGIEGFRDGKGTIDYQRILRAAYHKGVRVHGFAMVRLDALSNQLPFYSADSLSWKSGGMWKRVYTAGTGVFARARFLRLEPTNKEELNALHKVAINAGHRFAALLHPKRFYVATNFEGALAMQQMEDDITRIWEARGIHWALVDKAIREGTYGLQNAGERVTASDPVEGTMELQAG